MFSIGNSKYSSLVIAGLLAAGFVIAAAIAFWILLLSASAGQEWVTYTNEKYGYQIKATEKDGRILEENLLVIEADIPEGASTDPGGESRVFYLDNFGLFEYQLGIISCYETYLPWEELSNEMSLEDYAKTLYEIEMTNDTGTNYGQRLPVSSLNPVALDGKDAYVYVYGTERGDALDIRSTVVTENTEGNKCLITYQVTDHARGFDPEMLEQQLHWFNSFSWVK